MDGGFLIGTNWRFLLRVGDVAVYCDESILVYSDCVCMRGFGDV